MKIQFKSTRHALTIAKRIKTLLRSSGIRLTDGKTMEAAARVFGYADWHELSTYTKKSSANPSPWDDEVEEEVRTKREQLFVTRLAEALSIETDVATAMIADIGPTRRSSKTNTTIPEWRKMKNKLEEEDGFVSVVLNASSEEIRDGYLSDQNLSPHWDDKKYRSEIEHAGKTYEILLSRSQDLHGYGFAVHAIDAFMFSGGEVVGTFVGSVVKSKEPVSGPLFYRGCDDCNQRLADTADLLVDQYPESQFLGHGNSFLLVERWEVKTGALPKGSGRALLAGVGKILRKTDKRFGALVLVVDPSQFCAIPLNKRIKMASYSEAVSHLHDHFIQTNPQEMLGDKAELMLLTESTRAESPQAETILRNSKHFPKGNRSGVGFDALGLSEDQAAAVEEEILDLSDLDETLEGQPLAVPPDGVPSDFDMEWAMTVKSYKPAQAIWEMMPDDLVEITVNYRSAKPGDVSSLEYRFANGTSLDMSAEYLLFGDKFEFYPDALRTASGWRMRSNPYTDKYSLSDFFSVLKINSAFLFDGKKGEKPIMPSRPVTLKRSVISKSGNSVVV